MVVSSLRSALTPHILVLLPAVTMPGALGVGGLLVLTGVGMGMHSFETTQTLLASGSVLEGPMWIALGAAGG